MNYKKVIIENCEPTLCNPEDKFNDLIESGLSVNEALLDIMEDAILEKKIEEEYPDYYGEMYSGDGKGNWEVGLTEFQD